MKVQYYKYQCPEKSRYINTCNYTCEFSEHDRDTIYFMQNFANECGFYLEQTYLFDNRYMIKVKKGDKK